MLVEQLPTEELIIIMLHYFNIDKYFHGVNYFNYVVIIKKWQRIKLSVIKCV